jgi:hypothetical protein
LTNAPSGTEYAQASKRRERLAPAQRRAFDEAVELPPRKKKPPHPRGFLRDGARRTRTADLLGAIQALSQLSYSPGTP